MLLLQAARAFLPEQQAIAGGVMHVMQALLPFFFFLNKVSVYVRGMGVGYTLCVHMQGGWKTLLNVTLRNTVHFL